MGKPLSADLRKRIVAEVEDGNSRRGAAVRFGAAASTAARLQARYEETGSAAPARIGRPGDSGKPGPHRAFIIAHAEDKPGITMPEPAALLPGERGVGIDPSNLPEFPYRAGLTKNTSGIGERTRRCQGWARRMAQTSPAGDKGRARKARVHRRGPRLKPI